MWLGEEQGKLSGFCGFDQAITGAIYVTFHNSKKSSCTKTCLTGHLEYKYRVIFVLVSGVICTLRSTIG